MTTHDGLVNGLGRPPSEIAGEIAQDRLLTAEQSDVIGAGLEPTLVVAGAGSGKTETLSLRILYLLDNARTLFGRDISPEEILCLTFTRKAAAEIAERAEKRVTRLFGADPARAHVSVSTYNAYAAALAAEHGLRVAVDPGATVLTDAALWQLADSVVGSWDGDVETDSAVSSIVTAVPRLAAQARDHRVTPHQLRTWASAALAFMEALPKKEGGGPGPFTQDLGRVVGKVRSLISLAALIEEFDARKRANSLLDFSDQVDIAVKLAQIPAVQEIERSRYVAVLLDEFQDTSPPQLDLFAHLFGSTHPVMAVGDPNQAIYGFRGASADALRQFIDRFGGPRVRLGHLSVSWRNETSILAAANAVVAPLASGEVAGVPLRSRAEELGTAEPARRAPGVIATRLLTEEDEAAAVVGFIKGRRDELGHHPSKPVEAAILCRRRAQQRAIVDALAAAGMDYEVVGLGGLLDTPEVADLLALLEVAHDPSRGDALIRLLSGERVALGPRDLAALHDRAQELAGPRDTREGNAAIIDALAELPPRGWVSSQGRGLSDTAHARLTSLAAVIDAIRRHTYLPLNELVLFAERAWGLDIETAVARPDAAQRRAVDAFVDATRTFSMGAERATLGAFLAWLDAARSEENGLDAPVREPDPGAVQVLTVHASKGLEWDIVAVPGLNDGQFPSVGVPSASTPHYSDSAWLDRVGQLPHELRLDRDSLPAWAFRDSRDHRGLAESIALFKEASGMWRLEEERRLFYVALTRARSHVLLSGSWFASGVRRRQPSPYVTELLDAGTVSRGVWVDEPADDAPRIRETVTAPWPRPVTARQQQRRDLAARVAHAEATIGDAWDDAWPLARELAAILAERAERTGDDVPVPIPAHLSTSRLVSLQRDEHAFALQLRRPIPEEPSAAAHRGSALHAWIEAHFGIPSLWDDDGHIEAATDADLEALKQTFLASEWAQRVPQHVEADVELPIGGVTIRSRIDAVFGPGNGLDSITVVDWKSGRPPRDPEERAAREIQLSMYRIAWAEREGVKPEAVDAAFYYVATDETVRPERLLSRRELEYLVRRDDR